MDTVASTSQPVSGPLATATNKQTTGKKTRGKEGRKPTTAAIRPAEQKRRAQARAAVRWQTEKQVTKRQYEKDALVRKAALEADEWTANVKPASVWCLGCNREFQLDNRGRSYYPSNWERHRKKCRGILSAKNADGPPAIADEEQIVNAAAEEDEEFVDDAMDTVPRGALLATSQATRGSKAADHECTTSDEVEEIYGQGDDDVTGQSTHRGLRTVPRDVPVILYDPSNYAPYVPQGRVAGALSFTLRPATFTDTEINAFADRATSSSRGPRFYRGDSRELLNPISSSESTSDVSAGAAMLRAFQRQERMGPQAGWIGRA
ncbi:hypothetical protein LshimejAT787_1000360 [Lyophyllum shimeji]|uniref:Uncharacterized protein n=1 Tax=Lyophyllum shimeji TaxID=47721 RepID=A0A9P3PTJ3_LYOSH|nr:hypothetical protein LshimejAT787_1000360 [Lyophyllum shimeji]